MSERAELLSRAINYGVVQLPGRRFPGVVVQGDSLYNLVERLDKLRSLAESHPDEEVPAGLAELHDTLQAALLHYEHLPRTRNRTSLL